MTISSQIQLCVLHWSRICTLAALFAGCGTEPSPDLTGAWSISASYQGGALVCTLLGRLTLDASEPSLSGSLAEEQVDCTEAGTPLTIRRDTANLIGTVDGRNLSFTPQPPEGESACALFHFEGRVADDRMSGTVGTTPVFCQGTYVEMNGTWQAQRL
jgi:hypothetical protein